MRACSMVLVFCATLLHVAAATASAGVVKVTTEPSPLPVFTEDGQKGVSVSITVINNSAVDIELESLMITIVDQFELIPGNHMIGDPDDNVPPNDEKDFPINIHFETIDKNGPGVINAQMDGVTYTPPITITAPPFGTLDLNQVLVFDIPDNDLGNQVGNKDIGVTVIRITADYNDDNGGGFATTDVTVQIQDSPEPGTIIIWSLMAIIFGSPVVRNRWKRTTTIA
jgi:hypothetical protein